MSIVVENRLGTSKHQFILMLSPTYDALMPRQLKLETKYFMSEISGKITKTIASQPLEVNDQKRTGLVQRPDVSKLRLEQTQTYL